MAGAGSSLAWLTSMTEASDVIPGGQQQQIAEKLDKDAEVIEGATLG